MKELIEKHFDVIMTSIIGIVGILATAGGAVYSNRSTRKNLASQIKAQFATTTEKEWIEKVRIYLAEIIDYYLQLSSIILDTKGFNDKNDVRIHKNFAERDDYKRILNCFIKNRILLSLYLNFNNSKEDELYKATSNLWNKAISGIDLHKADDDITEIQSISHELFEEKLSQETFFWLPENSIS